MSTYRLEGLRALYRDTLNTAGHRKETVAGNVREQYWVVLQPLDVIDEVIEAMDVPHWVAEQWQAQEGEELRCAVKVTPKAEEPPLNLRYEVACALRRQAPPSRDVIQLRRRLQEIQAANSTEDRSDVKEASEGRALPQKLSGRAGDHASICPLKTHRTESTCRERNHRGEPLDRNTRGRHHRRGNKSAYKGSIRGGGTTTQGVGEYTQYHHGRRPCPIPQAQGQDTPRSTPHHAQTARASVSETQRRLAGIPRLQTTLLEVKVTGGDFEHVARMR